MLSKEVCEYCSDSFNSQNSLNIHKDTAHKKDIYEINLITNDIDEITRKKARENYQEVVKMETEVTEIKEKNNKYKVIVEVLSDDFGFGNELINSISQLQKIHKAEVKKINIEYIQLF